MVASKLVRVQDLDLYRPADFDGKVLRLHYARAEELEPTYLKNGGGAGEETMQWRYR